MKRTRTLQAANTQSVSRPIARNPAARSSRHSRHLLESLESRLLLSAFVVSNATDAGPGSLRQAILDANANPGLDSITFNIGSGPQSIAPASNLPSINDSLALAATTQPGFAGTPLIEITGNFTLGTGLFVRASNSTISGLVVNAFTGAGILLQGPSTSPALINITISGNYLGTNAAGNAARPNKYGILANAVSDSSFGGYTPADRNLISGNNATGIFLGAASHADVIAGNFIGTNAAGNAAIPNLGEGVGIVQASNGITIGGTLPGARNVISGNNIGIGIHKAGATGNYIQSNFIGTAADGTSPLGNSGNGITVEAADGFNVIGIGGIVSEDIQAGNTIAFNGGSGVAVDSNSFSQFIRGNSIYSNAGGGIDLSPAGPTPNDLGDADSGANFLQNSPVIAGVTYTADSTFVQVSLNTEPYQSYTLDFYITSLPAPGVAPQGAQYLGSTLIFTDGGGNARIDIYFAPTTPGDLVTATATSNEGTSEFSGRVYADAGENYYVDEGSPLVLAGSGSDAAGNPVTYSWDLNGDGIFGDSTAPTPTITPLDGYSRRTVALKVTNSTGESSISTATVNVNNVMPLFTSCTNSASKIGSTLPGKVVTIQGTFTDPGILDQHSALIYWGDGIYTYASLTESAGSGTFSATHIYAQAGAYSTSVSLSDEYSTANAYSYSYISGAAIGLDGVLQIVGTSRNDDVQVLQKPNGSFDVRANFLPHTLNFPAGSFWSVGVLLGDGNDSAIVRGNITAVLVGGAGNDLLSGGSGNNLLIGGAGSDLLIGGPAGDILIGGLFDNEGDLSFLSQVPAYGFGPFLGSQIHDDHATDIMLGLGGNDLAYARLGGPCRDILAICKSDIVIPIT